VIAVRGKPLLLGLVCLLITGGWPGGSKLGAASPDRLTLPEDKPLFMILEPSRESPVGGFPVLQPADTTSPEVQEKADLLTGSFAAQAVRLHWYVKNYLLRNVPEGEGAEQERASLDQPTYLCVSAQEGGFPRSGFWLRETSGLEDMTAVPYVELTDMPGHQFEAIFAHELGHVLLGQLSGLPGGGLSTWVHETTVRTDNLVAFDEGWATSFQPLAWERSPFASDEAERPPLSEDEVTRMVRRYTDELRSFQRRMGLPGPATLTLPLWFNRVQFELRRSFVPANWFIYQPQVPEGLLTADRSVYAALLYESIAAGLGPEARELKNPAQMLASEGVVASFFYRLLSEPSVQDAYEAPAFYERFLRPGAKVDWTRTSPRDLFSPLENAFLKVFRVMAADLEMGPDLSEKAPLLRFVEGFARRFPGERAAVYQVFLDITKGVTVEKGAAEPSPVSLGEVKRRLVEGEARVDDNVGPELWLYNPFFLVGLGLYDQFLSVRLPYTFDLNAATVVDLRTIPGVDLKTAREILRRREERGYFRSVEEVAGVAGVGQRTMNALAEMDSAMKEVLAGKRKHPWEGVSLSLSAIVLAYLWAALRKALVLLVGGWCVFRLAGRLAKRRWNPEVGRPAARLGAWRALGRLFAGIGLLLVTILIVTLAPPMSLGIRITAGVSLPPLLWFASSVRQLRTRPRPRISSLRLAELLVPLAVTCTFALVLL